MEFNPIPRRWADSSTSRSPGSNNTTTVGISGIQGYPITIIAESSSTEECPITLKIGNYLLAPSALLVTLGAADHPVMTYTFISPISGSITATISHTPNTVSSLYINYPHLNEAFAVLHELAQFSRPIIRDTDVLTWVDSVGRPAINGGIMRTSPISGFGLTFTQPTTGGTATMTFIGFSRRHPHYGSSPSSSNFLSGLFCLYRIAAPTGNQTYTGSFNLLADPPDSIYADYSVPAVDKYDPEVVATLARLGPALHTFKLNPGETFSRPYDGAVGDVVIVLSHDRMATIESPGSGTSDINVYFTSTEGGAPYIPYVTSHAEMETMAVSIFTPLFTGGMANLVVAITDITGALANPVYGFVYARNAVPASSQSAGGPLSFLSGGLQATAGMRKLYQERFSMPQGAIYENAGGGLNPMRTVFRSSTFLSHFRLNAPMPIGELKINPGVTNALSFYLRASLRYTYGASLSGELFGILAGYDFPLKPDGTEDTSHIIGFWVTYPPPSVGADDSSYSLRFFVVVNAPDETYGHIAFNNEHFVSEVTISDTPLPVIVQGPVTIGEYEGPPIHVTGESSGGGVVGGTDENPLVVRSRKPGFD